MRKLQLLTPAVCLILTSFLLFSVFSFKIKADSLIELINVDSNGNQYLGGSSANSTSADGRYVVFNYQGPSLEINGVTVTSPIMMRDTINNTTTIVSTNSDGEPANRGSSLGFISADGKYVVFESLATNLVPDISNTYQNIFIKNLQTGEVNIVNVDDNGNQPIANSHYPSVSADGRYVLFVTGSVKLDVTKPDTTFTVYIRDTQEGTTRGVVGESNYAVLSAEGRYVTYDTVYRSGVTGQVFRYDLTTGENIKVSVNDNGIEGNYESYLPSISADGRYISFTSVSNNLVDSDTNENYDIFLHDTVTGTTSIVSVASDGTQGNDMSWTSTISGDGKYVAFNSNATNLIGDDTNSASDLFVRNIEDSRTFRVSQTLSGNEITCGTYYESCIESIIFSLDGKNIIYNSWAQNMSPDVNSESANVFLSRVDLIENNLPAQMVTIDIPVISGTYRNCYAGDYPNYNLIGVGGPCSIFQIVQPDYSYLPTEGTFEKAVLSWDRDTDPISLDFYKLTDAANWITMPTIDTQFATGINSSSGRIYIDPQTFETLRTSGDGILIANPSTSIWMNSQKWKLQVVYSGYTPPAQPAGNTVEVTVTGHTFRYCGGVDYPDWYDYIGVSGPCGFVQVMQPDYSSLPNTTPRDVIITWDNSTGANVPLLLYELEDPVNLGAIPVVYKPILSADASADHAHISPAIFNELRAGTLGIEASLQANGMIDMDNNSWHIQVVYDNLWTYSDVGTQTPGELTISGGTFTVDSNGYNVGGNPTSYSLVHQTANGNKSISTRVVSQTNTSNYAKAGVIFTETIAADSKLVALVTMPTGQLYLQWRDETGGTDGWTQLADVSFPAYIKLERINNTFYAFKSDDGIDWGVPIASHTTAMLNSMEAGLAVSSNNNNQQTTAVFDSVGLEDVTTNNIPSPWSHTDVGSQSPGLVSFNNGEFDVISNGYNVGGNPTSYSFVHQTTDGNKSVSTKVISQTNTSNYAKAGVIFTETTAADSKLVALVTMPTGQLYLQWRDTTGGSDGWVQLSDVSFPTYVKLERVGNNFHAYKSADGIDWGTPIASHTTTMQSSVETGLCISSNNNSSMTLAKFDSATIGDSTTNNLPSPWSFNDVGTPNMLGSASENNGEFTIVSGGYNVGGNPTSFSFVHQTKSGDAIISAKVTSQVNTSSYAKAGVAFTESTSSDTKLVALVVMPTGDLYLQWRDTTGGTDGWTLLGNVQLPVYLKLERSGDTFTAYKSTDGIDWGTALASHTVTMQSSLETGLCVSSNNNNALNTAIFEEVTVN